MQHRTEPDVPASGQTRFTGRHMLMIMVAFFGTVIAVNGYMAYRATSSWTGLIVKNGYVASQDFNSLLAAARTQAARGWTGNIDYRNGTIEFGLIDKAGDPVDVSNVVALVGRPAFERDDRKITLTARGSGIYQAADSLEAGPWQITVTADSAQGPYRLEKRILVRKGTAQ